jgi:hypothetical protein
LEFAEQDFLIGDQPTCDVFFDPAADPHAAGGCVRVYCAEEGWRAQRLAGNTLLVNHELLEAEISLRSGDVIRLSESGPDLCFVIALPASPPAASNDVPIPPQDMLPTDIETAEPQPVPRPQETPVPARGPVGPREPVWPWWGLVFGLAVAAVLLAVPFLHKPRGPAREPVDTATSQVGRPVVGAGQASAAPRPVSAPERPAKSSAKERAAIGLTSLVAKLSASAPPIDAASVRPSAERVTKEASGPSSKAPPTPAAQTAGPVERAGTARPPATAAPTSPMVVLAIENEADRLLEPFALGCAVEQQGQEMLLSTARIVRIMMLWRDHKRYYAVLAGGADARPRIIEIDRDRIYMHLLYITALEHKDWEGAEYFDVGAMCCVEKFPAAYPACSLASREAVERLEAGSALRCDRMSRPAPLAFADGKSGDRKSGWKVLVEPVRLDRALRLEASGGAGEADEVRRLFELDAPGDAFREGSPVFDDRGQLVALCTKTVGAAARGVSSVVGRPRAALVDAELLAALWSGQPSKQWFGYARKDREGEPSIPPVQERPNLSTP